MLDSQTHGFRREYRSTNANIVTGFVGTTQVTKKPHRLPRAVAGCGILSPQARCVAAQLSLARWWCLRTTSGRFIC